MSVCITLRIAADPDRAERVASQNAETMRSIAEDAKRHGALHHRFVAGEGEIMAIDEWVSQEAFQAFFSANADIPRVLQQAGVTGQPRVDVWRAIDMRDEF